MPFFDDLEAIVGAAEVATGTNERKQEASIPNQPSSPDMQVWAFQKATYCVSHVAMKLDSADMSALHHDIIQALQDAFAEGVKRGSGMSVIP